MDIMSRICCALLVVLNIVAVGTLRISTKNSVITASAGSNRSLPCTIEGKKYSFFHNPVIWYKLLEDGSRVQINTGAVINKPFGGTGRYSIEERKTRDTLPGSLLSLTMALAIKGSTLAENGTYVCELLNFQSVKDNVTHVLLVTGPKRFHFTELDRAYVACRATRGYPLPSLRVIRAGDDVTHAFKPIARERLRGDVGLEVIDYELELINQQFHVTRNYDGRELVCELTQGNAKHLTRRLVAIMDVKYAPVFDCAEDFFVLRSAVSLNITCTVHANPPIDSRTLRWKLGEDTRNSSATTLGLRSQRDGYKVSVQFTPVRTTHKVQLTIANVTSRHFQPYRVSVANSVGGAQHRLVLAEGKPKITKATLRSGTERSIDSRQRGKGPPYVIRNRSNNLSAFTILVTMTTLVTIAAR